MIKLFYLLLIFSFSKALYAQETTSYVFYDSGLFENALNYTKEVLGEDKVVVTKDQGINDYVRKITEDLQSGKIKPGDQVLLQIYTHGAPNKGEISHKLNIRSEDNDLDDLIPLRNKLETMGIKVAIIDGSCFSGNSLGLSSDKTCVISSQSQKFEASAAGGAKYETFAEMFWKQRKDMNKEQSLNETFFNAREILKNFETFSKDRPEISEPFYMAIREKYDDWFYGYQLRAERVSSLFKEMNLNLELISNDKFYCDLNFEVMFPILPKEQTSITDLNKIAILNAFQTIREDLISFYQTDIELQQTSKIYDGLMDEYSFSTSEEEKKKLRNGKLEEYYKKLTDLRYKQKEQYQQINDHENALFNLLNKQQLKETPCQSFKF